MASLNKIMIMGNLGADPELRFTANGDGVTTFNVATNEAYTGQDGTRHDRTEWFSVVAWRKLAETCAQYLEKGRSVYVEGRMQTRSWEKDGQKHYRTEVVAERVVFLGGQGERQESGGVGRNEAWAPAGGAPDDSDIPFSRFDIPGT